jgi:hypothetical protein
LDLKNPDFDPGFKIVALESEPKKSPELEDLSMFERGD